MKIDSLGFTHGLIQTYFEQPTMQFDPSAHPQPPTQAVILASGRSSRILLLLRRLPEVIREYFGAYCRSGVEIVYSGSAADDEIAGRLKLALSRLGPYFLQLYCDDCWPPMEN